MKAYLTQQGRIFNNNSRAGNFLVIRVFKEMRKLQARKI